MALLQVDFFSDVLQMSTQMEVILPQITKNNPHLPHVRADGTYPVLYLLHGMHSNHTAWLRFSSIERYVEKLGIAVVMPSVDLGWYTDTAYGQKYWTFVSQELPRICREFFPNMSKKREETFASGLSMGGYGALKCGLLASETFGAVASLSGAVDIIANLAQGTPADEAEKVFWCSVFGPKETMLDSKNDLRAAAKNLATSGKPRPAVYLWCGTEDFLYNQNTFMRDHLTKLGFDLTYEESAGDHDMRYWDEKIQRVLEWLPLTQKTSAPSKNI